MVSTLKEVSQLQRLCHEVIQEGRRSPYSINVTREVRYYADIDGTRYALLSDWETQAVTEYIDQFFNKKETNSED